jgi:hypothetical protein
MKFPVFTLRKPIQPDLKADTDTKLSFYYLNEPQNEKEHRRRAIFEDLIEIKPNGKLYISTEPLSTRLMYQTTAIPRFTTISFELMYLRSVSTGTGENII